MNRGWISIHRKMQEHWIWDEKRVFSRAEAWIDILFTVNHKEQKTMIKNKLFTIKRGESIRSLQTWSDRWNWDKSKVRRFFDLLQSDNMIEIKNERVTTRLIVVNYGDYQDTRNANETQVKQKRNANETHLTPNNNTNNINNINNDEEEEKKDIDIDVDIFLDVDILMQNYLDNKKLCKAFVNNAKNKITDESHLKERLIDFVQNLKEVGRFKETFSEFSAYFRNWNKSVKPKEKKPTNLKEYEQSLRKGITF